MSQHASKIEQFLSSTEKLPEICENIERNVIEEKLERIFVEFDYQVYTKSYQTLPNFIDSILNDKKCQLENEEIWHILAAKDEHYSKKIINFFVDTKLQQFLNRKEGKPVFTSKINKYEGYPESGMFHTNGELIYGLWRNSMFSQCTRAQNSRLNHRKFLRMFPIQDTPKLYIDLRIVNDLSYFKHRVLAAQLHKMMSFNKYSAYHPFNMEFITHEDKISDSFTNIMQKTVIGWNTEKFEYPFHKNFSLIDKVKQGKIIYAIAPFAKNALSESEVLSPNAEFLIPGYTTRDLRDPLFSKFKDGYKHLNIRVRRLPTEIIQWKNHHGVVNLHDTLAILNDARYDTNFDWEKSFRRHLTKLIYSEEEMQDISENRRNLVLNRELSAKKNNFVQEDDDFYNQVRSILGDARSDKFPDKIPAKKIIFVRKENDFNRNKKVPNNSENREKIKFTPMSPRAKKSIVDRREIYED